MTDVVYVAIAVVGSALLATTLCGWRRTEPFGAARILLGVVIVTATVMGEWLVHEVSGIPNFDGYELNIVVH